MNSKSVKKPGKLNLAVICILLVLGLGVNIACAAFRSTLDQFMGSRAELSDELLQAGNTLAEQIQAEGTVLLRNEESVLPLSKDVNKVNVFGWSATQWITGGSGSGQCATLEVDLLAALKEAGVEYNQELIDAYSAPKKGGFSPAGENPPFSLFFFLRQSVLVSPLAHSIQNRDQGFATLGQAVFYLGWDLRVFLPVDQLVCLQLFQGGAQGLVGDFSNVLFHLIEADDAEFHESVEDGHLVFPVDERQGIAEPCRAKTFVCNTALSHFILSSV